MTERKRAKKATRKPARKTTRRAGPRPRRIAASTTIIPYRDLEIQTRRVDLDPAWRALIEDEVAALADRHPQLLRTHVTLSHALHQKRQRATVSIVANAAGRVLRVEKRKETMEGALRLALGALARAAEDLRRPKRALRPRRGRDVVPAQRPIADVAR